MAEPIDHVAQAIRVADGGNKLGAAAIAEVALAALLALPVEKRMEAMGMRAVDLHGGQRVVWVED